MDDPKVSITFKALPQDFEKIMAQYQEAYENGNKGVILYAILDCVERDQLLPVWLKKAFFDAFWSVQDWEVRSWDDVFGKPHPKGTNLEATRNRILYPSKVYQRIEELREAGQAVGVALFEKVGRELGIGGKTLTEQFYYQEKRRRQEIMQSYERYISKQK
jgi:hypothetical protein